MNQYKELIRNVLENGTFKQNRTGVGTWSIFGTEMRFKMSDGFSLVTTKFVPFNAVAHELIWLLSGNTNIEYLKKHGVTIWDAWADECGELGPVYGEQWRRWRDVRIVSDGDVAAGLECSPQMLGYRRAGTTTDDYGVYIREIDQLQNCIDTLRTNPLDRRMIVSSWNPSYLPDDTRDFSENVANGFQALPPCHAFFQFYATDGRLSLKITQRSCDVFLGVPFNIASYALLLHMVAQQVDMVADELIWSGGDTHIYENHVEHCRTILGREELVLPQLELSKAPSIDDYTIEHMNIVDYYHHTKLTGSVAV